MTVVNRQTAPLKNGDINGVKANLTRWEREKVFPLRDSLDGHRNRC